MLTKVDAMEKELGRFRCVAEDGSCIDVIEYQHVSVVDTDMGVRLYPGARRMVTANNEIVRYIDKATFEIVDTGELVHRLD